MASDAKSPKQGLSRTLLIAASAIGSTACGSTRQRPGEIPSATQECHPPPAGVQSAVRVEWAYRRHPSPGEFSGDVYEFHGERRYGFLGDSESMRVAWVVQTPTAVRVAIESQSPCGRGHDPGESQAYVVLPRRPGRVEIERCVRSVSCAPGPVP